MQNERCEIFMDCILPSNLMIEFIEANFFLKEKFKTMRVNLNKMNLLHLISSPCIYIDFNKIVGFPYLSYDNHLDYRKYIILQDLKKLNLVLNFFLFDNIRGP
jgi:hypothetical protein